MAVNPVLNKLLADITVGLDTIILKVTDNDSFYFPRMFSK
jgi:hypothetical protein